MRADVEGEEERRAGGNVRPPSSGVLTFPTALANLFVSTALVERLRTLNSGIRRLGSEDKGLASTRAPVIPTRAWCPDVTLRSRLLLSLGFSPRTVFNGSNAGSAVIAAENGADRVISDGFNPSD